MSVMLKCPKCGYETEQLLEGAEYKHQCPKASPYMKYVELKRK